MYINNIGANSLDVLGELLVFLFIIFSINFYAYTLYLNN